MVADHSYAQDRGQEEPLVETIGGEPADLFVIMTNLFYI